ncbi:MAG: response regulator transcription factor, partial [Clostridiales bacterium]|nr:response regulator transcription factor [Clostridiales bacterium]
MSQGKILVIEDDIDLSNVMQVFLSNDGFEVVQAYTGSEGLEAVKTQQPLLIILDIMLPGIDGISICKRIREVDNIPIIVISAKNTDTDKVLALGVGADDYLTKPFSQVELVARVKSHIRRATVLSASEKEKGQAKKVFGTLVIDPVSYEVTVNGKAISLSPKEFLLLDYLSDHPSQVFTKHQILDHIWGCSEYVDDNTIAVYVGRIREKLAKEKIDYIKTVWG